MKAIVLAAGRGSRMGHLTKETPKCLTVIKGKPLIEHIISNLIEAGISDIAIVTGYLSSSLKKYGNFHFHNINWFQTNMLSSLLCAKEWLDNDDCLVSYSDIYYNKKIIEDLINCEDDLAIGYDPNWRQLWERRFENPLDDAETFRIDKDGYLLEIGKKTTKIQDIEGQYMGLLKFHRNFFNLNFLNKISFEKMDMTTFLNLLILKDIRIKAVPNYEFWSEIDHPNDIRIFESLY